MSTTSTVKTLYLPENKTSSIAKEQAILSVETRCPLCEQSFDGNAIQVVSHEAYVKEVNTHLVKQHRFVITDFGSVPDVSGYLAYWRDQFSVKPLTEFCSVIKTNCGHDDVGESEDYYVLSPDVLVEDKKLREQLAVDKLSKVLSDQEQERSATNFRRRCLFCKKIFSPNRSVLLDHLLHDHNFSIGLPDNIVYISEFLDLIEAKLEKRLCLYCEKTFTSWDVLKEHMRKKQHKIINPENKEYDRFYLINYLEPGKDWRSLISDDKVEEKEFTSQNDDQEWADWSERPGAATSAICCLFCDSIENTFDGLKRHIKEVHAFDLDILREWPFYGKVKLVNYIRRCAHLSKCFYCQEGFESSSELFAHLKATQHSSLVPADSLWDVTEYFFPTYENDELLHNLDDNDDGDLDSQSVIVIPEDANTD